MPNDENKDNTEKQVQQTTSADTEQKTTGKEKNKDKGKDKAKEKDGNVTITSNSQNSVSAVKSVKFRHIGEKVADHGAVITIGEKEYAYKCIDGVITVSEPALIEMFRNRKDLNELG